MPDINPEKHYVLDQYRDVVVAGPLSEQAALREAAERGIEDHIAITGSSLQQVADGRALAWETGEVRQVTDGGVRTTTATATEPVSVEQRTCPECGGRVRTADTETTCTDCGLVVDEHTIDHGPEWRRFDDEETNPERCHPGDRDRADRGLGSDPPRFQARGTEHDREVAHRNQIARTGWSQKDRNRNYATTEIDRLADALELPDPVAEQAKRAFRAWHDSENLPGQDLDQLAAAALLYAARAVQAGVTAEDVLAVARTDGAVELRRAMHQLADAVGVAVRLPSPQARVDRLAGDSDLDIDAATQSRARALLADPPSGRSPSALAAAALYLAGGGQGRKADGEWTQQELASVAGICAATVRNAASELRPGYGGGQ